MPYKQGDKVVARRSLGMGSVPKGATGTVIDSSFLGSYTVRFGSTTLRSVSRDDIDSSSGCSMLLLVGPTLATIGALVVRHRRSQSRA